MSKSISVSPRAARPATDRDGNSVSNRILLSLPSRECGQILSRLEFVRLKLHQVLHEPGETIKSCYFVNAGLMSVLAVQPDGRMVEVGLIGREGLVGLPLLVGYSNGPTRVMVQADGTAYRCDAASLKELVQRFPELERGLHRFAYQLAMQTTQIAACNRLHDVVERLARWILMSQDRILTLKLPLTQEFLAQMLGTRRSSVTVAAGALQRAGLISCTRGSVTILNRKELEMAACDCYRIVRQQLKDWEAELT
ncbi:MAG TPA: Crp/Fnr family transcriptional regulator [Candidatus Dormibacteraeota bacterium]|nr:Crp/Fnr family transcriptional regulator [Candidatus Dormibacteraeota bacterium]